MRHEENAEETSESIIYFSNQIAAEERGKKEKSEKNLKEEGLHTLHQTVP